MGLNDDRKPQQQTSQQATRKRGFFSKFGGEHLDVAQGNNAPAVSRFLMPGRKRAQSGQGSELGQIERPQTASSIEQEVQA